MKPLARRSWEGRPTRSLLLLAPGGGRRYLFRGRGDRARNIALSKIIRRRCCRCGETLKETEQKKA